MCPSARSTFGMAVVESRASVVVGNDLASERATVEAALAALRAKVAQLEAAGHGGGESACTSEQQVALRQWYHKGYCCVIPLCR